MADRRRHKPKRLPTPPAPADASRPQFTRANLQTRKVNGFNGRVVEAIDSDAVDPFLTADLTLTARIAAALERHYPAHPWMVKVQHAHGVAMVSLPLLMKQPYILHIDKLDPGLNRVVMAAGELLEKLNMPRHGFSLDRFLHAREQGPFAPKKKPKPKLLVPEFASSARPKAA